MANLVGVWPKLFLLKKSCEFECQGDRPCSNRGLRSDTTNLGQASEWVRQRGSHRQPNSDLRLTGYLRPTARKGKRRKKQPPTWLPPLSSFAARTQGHSRVALFKSTTFSCVSLKPCRNVSCLTTVRKEHLVLTFLMVKGGASFS